ncbi:MAG: hypothetical protein Q8O81_12790 [Giesbergeria sp.]|nr:hypothetical protein [Giesbergeria sp.]
MNKKSKWTDRIYHPISVLNHADGLHLEKFTDEDLDQIAGCDDVYDLSLRSSKTDAPIDLARLAHIKGLHTLSLARVKFTNLKALRALPHLRQLVIENGAFTDFDDLNGFNALKYLFLWNNKLTEFPAGLDLPQLSSLYLSHSRISDLRFVASYPTLRDLHVNDNGIADVSPLAACTWLEELHLDENPIPTLAPLAGLRLKKLRVNSVLQKEKVALQLELPEEPYERDADGIEASRIARLMESKDWTKVYAITDLAALGKAFSYVVHGHADAEMIRGALAHPTPGAFESMVENGLRPHYSSVADLVTEIFSEFGERLIPPMTKSLQVVLERATYLENFYVGKLKSEHFTIARILQKAASPAFADMFLAFFHLREDFSALHLGLYKRLLDVAGKTKSPLLVEPLIDLLRFEKHIIGGDPAFMKKVFKAIGQLGAKADAAVLASRFDVAAEARPDVVDAYHDAVVRLGKKKA